MRTIETNHDVSLVSYDTFLSCFEKSFLLHQFQGVKSSSGFKSSKKDSTKTSSSNALNNLEILELNVVMKLLPPNGLYLKKVAFEDFDGFTSLKIVVFEDIGPPRSFPIIYTRRSEIVIICVKG